MGNGQNPGYAGLLMAHRQPRMVSIRLVGLQEVTGDLLRTTSDVLGVYLQNTQCSLSHETMPSAAWQTRPRPNPAPAPGATQTGQYHARPPRQSWSKRRQSQLAARERQSLACNRTACHTDRQSCTQGDRGSPPDVLCSLRSQFAVQSLGEPRAPSVSVCGHQLRPFPLQRVALPLQVPKCGGLGAPLVPPQPTSATPPAPSAAPLWA